MNKLFRTLAVLIALFCSGFSAYEIFTNDLNPSLYFISLGCAILAAIIVIYEINLDYKHGKN